MQLNVIHFTMHVTDEQCCVTQLEASKVLAFAPAFAFILHPWAVPLHLTPKVHTRSYLPTLQHCKPRSHTTMPSFLLVPQSSADPKLQQGLRLSLNYFLRAGSPTNATVPETVQLDLPEHLEQGIAEWLEEFQIGLSVDGEHVKRLQLHAVLCSTYRAPDLAHTDVETGKSALLSLPPKMRNRIYRAALVSDGRDILIRPSIKPAIEPALLRTCQQIRNEATEMYYQENTFRFCIRDNNAAILTEWCSLSAHHFHANMYFRVTGSTNWRNLVDWLHAYYHRCCHGIEPADDGTSSEVVAHMFSVVQNFRQGGNLAWGEVAKTLEIMRKVLGAQDPAWLVDDE